MCLIVDINIAEAVLLKANHPDYCTLHRNLFGKKAPLVRLVYGGKLLDEYRANRDILHVIHVLDQAGRARAVAGDLIEAECKALKKLDVCTSDDVHILALARAGRVRLVCTHDRALRADVGNKEILDNPRGKVYSKTSHTHLLRKFC